MVSPDVAKEIDQYLSQEIDLIHQRIDWLYSKNLAATLLHTFWVDDVLRFFWNRRSSRLRAALWELDDGNPKPVVDILQTKLGWEYAASIASMPRLANGSAIDTLPIPSLPPSPLEERLSSWIREIGPTPQANL